MFKWQLLCFPLWKLITHFVSIHNPKQFLNSFFFHENDSNNSYYLFLVIFMMVIVNLILSWQVIRMYTYTRNSRNFYLYPVHVALTKKWMPNSIRIVFEASEFDGTGEFCSICVNCNCDSYEKFVVKCLPSALPFFF